MPDAVTPRDRLGSPREREHPAFAGAQAAAARLASLPTWPAARVVKSTPTPPSSRCGPEPWPRASSCPGFSDLELALLVEAGLIGTDTVVATTVHPLQVLEEGLPETGHDFRLDLVVAGEEVIGCRRTRRPQGIIWEHLDPAKVAAIPALAARVRQHGTL